MCRRDQWRTVTGKVANWLVVCVLALAASDALASGPDVERIKLEGDYFGHLQDVWWDGGTNLWWAHTRQLLRTDMTGKILAKADVSGHNAGLEVRDGRLYNAGEEYGNGFFSVVHYVPMKVARYRNLIEQL